MCCAGCGKSIPGGRNSVSKDLEMGDLRAGVGLRMAIIGHLPGCSGQGRVQSMCRKEVESGLNGTFGSPAGTPKTRTRKLQDAKKMSKSLSSFCK